MVQKNAQFGTKFKSNVNDPLLNFKSVQVVKDKGSSKKYLKEHQHFLELCDLQDCYFNEEHSHKFHGIIYLPIEQYKRLVISKANVGLSVAIFSKYFIWFTVTGDALQNVWVQQHVQPKQLRNIKCAHNWPFLRGIHQDSPHKVPVMQKAFCCTDSLKCSCVLL